MINPFFSPKLNQALLLRLTVLYELRCCTVTFSCIFWGAGRVDRWWMSSGQWGCHWTAHCDRIIKPELNTMTVIKANHSRLPRERYYRPCQVITPLSENKAFRDALSCPNQLSGSDSNKAPFRSGRLG